MNNGEIRGLEGLEMGRAGKGKEKGEMMQLYFNENKNIKEKAIKCMGCLPNELRNAAARGLYFVSSSNSNLWLVTEF